MIDILYFDEIEADIVFISHIGIYHIRYIHTYNTYIYKIIYIYLGTYFFLNVSLIYIYI